MRSLTAAAAWLVVTVLCGSAHAQVSVSGICNAVNNSQVDCSGVTFEISGQAASKFIEDFINRRYRGRSFANAQQLAADLQGLNARFEQHEAQVRALMQKVELLEQDRVAEGMIELNRGDADRELLMSQLAVVLELEAKTAALSAKYEDLERRMKELVDRLNSVWTGYSLDKPRLRVMPFYEYRSLGSEMLHGVGLSVAVRAPTALVLQLGASWAYLRGSSEATYVGGEPGNVILEYGDAAAEGWRSHIEVAIGYAFEPVAGYLSFGPRYTTLASDLDAAQRHDAWAWDWPLAATLDVRPIVGLIVSGSVGWTFDEGVPPPQYRYSISGRSAAVGDGEAASSTLFVRLGLGYVVAF